MKYPRLSPIKYLPIVMVSAGLFLPGLIKGQVMFWGTPILQFVPWSDWAWKTLLSGHLPLWNPLVGMGAPLLANYQSALVYPPNWLLLGLEALGGVSLLAWGHTLLVVLHLVWAGVGMMFLIRRIGLNTLAQTIGGLAFAFSGYLVSRAGFFSINATIAWLPWVVLFVTPSTDGSEKHDSFWKLIFCLTLQMLAGHAQTLWYTLVLAGMWSGFFAWQTAHSQYGGFFAKLHLQSMTQRVKGFTRHLISAWGRYLLGFLIACGLASIQLFPTAEYFLQSQRSEAVDYELAMTYSFWPWRLLTLASPDLFGSPVSGDYWGYGNYWEDAIYIGLLPLLFALSTIVGLIPKRKRQTGEMLDEKTETYHRALPRFLIFLMLITILLALGNNTPVFPWLYKHLPTFDLFQAPSRYMVWAEFSLVLLAAYTANRWRRPEKRALYWSRLGAAGAFAITLGAGIGWYFMGDISPTFVRATALAGFWGLGAGILNLLAPPRQRSEQSQLETNKLWVLPVNIWQIMVISWVALDLFVAVRGLNPMVESTIFRDSPTANKLITLLNGHRLYLSSADEYELKFDRFLRFDTFDLGEDWANIRSVFLPNLTMLDRISSVNNFDPLLPGDYAKWMDELASLPIEKQTDLLRLMDVGVIERIDRREPYGVNFENVDSSMRVRWVPCAYWVPDATDAWNMVTQENGSFLDTVILERSGPEEGITCNDRGNLARKATIGIQEETPGHIIIELNIESSGWVVLSDTWYPGWRAYVDGIRTEIIKANYLFKAIEVESGEHQIELKYQPLSFWLGCALSLVSCIGLVVYLLRKNLRKKGIE